jgi:hypothetical protein
VWAQRGAEIGNQADFTADLTGQRVHLQLAGAFVLDHQAVRSKCHMGRPMRGDGTRETLDEELISALPHLLGGNCADLSPDLGLLGGQVLIIRWRAA